MKRLLIADDHKLFREGLKRVLFEISSISVIDEASNGQEVLEKVAANCYDVILLDISMPGRNGLDILKQLKSNNWNVHVLIISMHSEEEYAERALRAGAFGYITKDCSPDELISAIRKVAAGKKYISPAVAETLAWHLDAKRTLGGRPAQNISRRREGLFTT